MTTSRRTLCAISVCRKVTHTQPWLFLRAHILIHLDHRSRPRIQHKLTDQMQSELQKDNVLCPNTPTRTSLHLNQCLGAITSQSKQMSSVSFSLISLKKLRSALQQNFTSIGPRFPCFSQGCQAKKTANLLRSTMETTNFLTLTRRWNPC